MTNYLPFFNNPWRLSLRESQVLALSVTMSQVEIAKVFGIGVATTRTHILKARMKMRVKHGMTAVVLFDRWWQEVLKTCPDYTIQALKEQLGIQE